MDLSALTTLIGSVGFPIVMCVILFNFVSNQQKQLTDAVNELKILINKLIDRIDRLEGQFNEAD